MPLPKPCKYCGKRILNRGRHQEVCKKCSMKNLKKAQDNFYKPRKHIGRKGNKSYSDAVVICTCPYCNHKEQFFLIGDLFVQCIMCHKPYDKIKYAKRRVK